jgi:hypothetical protein
VAANTVLAIWIAHLNLEVIAVFAVESTCNFLVAIQAPKRRRAGAKLVASGALCGSSQGLMRFGKRSGRYLRSQGCGAGDEGEKTSNAEGDAPRNQSEIFGYTLRARLEAVQAALRRAVNSFRSIT